MRAALSGFLALLLVVASTASAQVNRRSWISLDEAARHGLVRQFVTQIEIDRSGDQVAGLVLEGDMIFAQSNRGVVHALDAESGRTLWVRQIGRRGYANLPASANHEYLCVPRDTVLYIVGRRTGRVEREIDLMGAASGPTAMGDEWVYVPMTSGKVRAFHLLDPPDATWAYRGTGLTDSRPLVTSDQLLWNSLGGYVYACAATRPEIHYEVKTGGPLHVALAYRSPLVYAASDDRILYAIEESSGRIVWRLPIGEAPRHEAIVIGDDLYLVGRVDGIFAIDAVSGVVKWQMRQVREFISASADHLYVADGFGRTIVLDRASGAALDALATEALEMKYTNAQNDRLYLGRPSGLLCCFHEVGLPEPLVHRESSTPPETEADPFATGEATP